jgi:NADH-quinone oxidoreductase subunit J
MPGTLGIPIALGVVGYLFAVASPRRRRSAPAMICFLAAAVCAWVFWWRPGQPLVEGALFTAFAGLMVVSGCGMQVEANPVYAALWFALVILSTCGLFLMEGAAFVSAATIIIYAGAIVVTFLFVIMLARQTGSAQYDNRFRQPVMAAVLGGLMLAVLVFVIQKSPQAAGDSPAVVAAQPVSLSAPTAGDRDTLSVLGRSLFVDHLWSVEVAGVLLLVATFGTILISLQTREERR